MTDKEDAIRTNERYKELKETLTDAVEVVVKDGKAYIPVEAIGDVVDMLIRGHNNAIDEGYFEDHRDFYGGQSSVGVILMAICDVAVQKAAPDLSLDGVTDDLLDGIQDFLGDQDK